MFGKSLPKVRPEMEPESLRAESEERVALIDNGSLRAESTLSLRTIARRLEASIGARVHPVSLLHSSKVDPASLGGERADTWRRFLHRELASGARRFLALPLFFGPSAAIVEYLPKVFSEATAAYPEATLTVGRPLVARDDPQDDAVARILAALVDDALARSQFGKPPRVIVVDHGSPAPAVAACRDQVARQMERLLGARVAGVSPASMERREGDAYAFNEPLLARALAELDASSGTELVLSLMFVSPGRHAGPGGDIARIVEDSPWKKAGRAAQVCDLVGESPALVELLARRYRELAAG